MYVCMHSLTFNFACDGYKLMWMNLICLWKSLPQILNWEYPITKSHAFFWVISSSTLITIQDDVAHNFDKSTCFQWVIEFVQISYSYIDEYDHHLNIYLIECTNIDQFFNNNNEAKHNTMEVHMLIYTTYTLNIHHLIHLIIIVTHIYIAFPFMVGFVEYGFNPINQV